MTTTLAIRLSPGVAMILVLHQIAIILAKDTWLESGPKRLYNARALIEIVCLH
jgi:hypothetical protein